MNSSAHYDAAFSERAERRRDKRSNGCKNNRGIEFLRRHFVGTAGPHGAKSFGGSLCCLVAGASEREDFAPFVNRDLCDQMRGVAEPVNAKTPRIACFPI